MFKDYAHRAALFVQNWDSAVMSDLMISNNSKLTVHDAIGVSKGDKSKLKALQSSVAKAMTKAQNHNPLEDLAAQIIKQHKKNKTPQQKLNDHQKALEKALKALRKSNMKHQFNEVNDHFAPE
jgi:hypothetical protein